MVNALDECREGQTLTDILAAQMDKWMQRVREYAWCHVRSWQLQQASSCFYL